MRRLKRILFILVSASSLSAIGAMESFGPSVVEEITPPTQEEIDTLERRILKETLIEKVQPLVPTESIAEAVVSSCIEYTEDVNLCIKSVLGVANAESGMFRKSMTPSNNGFGFMERGSKKKFPSVEESISFWVKRYQDKQRYKRTTGASWLKGNYCTSACSYRIGNYNDAVRKLGL